MFNKIKQLFSSGKPAYKQLVEQGAIIVDVRSQAEYNSGHIHNAINIPLELIPNSIAQLKAKQIPIITCCRSGMRSGIAASALSAKGIKTYNGGAWNSLEKHLKQ